jgi:predicted nucleic acid-binding protein
LGFMNLDDISNGSLCVIDTNVLLYAEQSSSLQAQRLLRRCSTGELISFMPQTVWLELTHKLMLAEAMMLGKISGPNPSRKLAKQPDLVRTLGLYRDKILALVDLGIGFAPCTREDFFEGALKFQEKYGLLANDSVILAIALRLKADVLVSADTAFQKVTELKVAIPSDIH